MAVIGCRSIGMALLISLVSPADPAGAEVPDVTFLKAIPSCVDKRFTQVTTSIGSKELNMRTGMSPSSVSYKKAFARLADAARKKGANALVIQRHEAAYMTKGAKRARRPNYISFQGAPLLLKESTSDCRMMKIDPIAFEENALDRELEEVSIYSRPQF